MAVTQQTPLNTYTANGLTTSFAFAFLVLEAGDLVVQVTDLAGDTTTKSIGADYTISGLGVLSGGSITFLVAPANGFKVALYRDTDLARATDYQTNGDLPSATLDADFDRLWLALQEVGSGVKAVGNAVRAPVGESLVALPAASVRALKYLAFDAAGNVVTATPSDGGSAAGLALTLLNASTNGTGFGDAAIGWGAVVAIVDGVLTRYASLAAAVTGIGANRCTVVVRDDITMAASATFPATATLRVENGARITTTGFTLTVNGSFSAGMRQCFAGTGTVVFGARAVMVVVPQWWGATADGTTDDTTALQAALTAAAGNMLYLPPGTYRITTGLLAPTNTAVRGAGRDATLISYTGTTTIGGTGGAMLRWVGASAISLRDIGFRVTNAVIANATTMLLLRNSVYFDVTDISFGCGTTTSGQCSIVAVLCDQDTSGFVPPRGNGVFRNFLAVVEPGDAGAAASAGIYVKGHASQAMNSIVFDGEGDIEHFAFGIKLENAANCYVGAWQIRQATNTEIALVNADATTIAGANIIPTATTGKAITIDAATQDTLILNPSINISSGLPASCITDLGSRTTIIGQGAPGAQTFPGKLPGAWVMEGKPDGVGPNLSIVRSTTDTGQSGVSIARSGSSLTAPAFFGVAAGSGIGGMDIERFEVSGVIREKLDANGQRCLYVPNGTPGGGALNNSQMTFYLSQGTNQLTALCKYSDGTVKTVTWNLV